MTPQPRGPARPGIPVDAIAHAQAIADQRLLAALLQYGPLKFQKLARLGLPNTGLNHVRDGVARLERRGLIRRDVAYPETWTLTTSGRAQLPAQGRAS